MSVCPSVYTSVANSQDFPSYLVYYAIGNYAEHNVWSYDMKEGRGVTYLEVATQLTKVTTPIIMYGHMMTEGGGE